MQKMYAMGYNKDELKVIGAFLLPHSVHKGGPLLRVLDMLENVDLLRLTHTSSAMYGMMLQRYLHDITKGNTPYWSWSWPVE